MLSNHCRKLHLSLPAANFLKMVNEEVNLKIVIIYRDRSMMRQCHRQLPSLKAITALTKTKQCLRVKKMFNRM